MHPSLKPYEVRVETGLLRKSEDEDLVLYTYTDQCTFEKAWDQYTRAARGIIFEKATGKVVARPFEKFFNLNEMPETTEANLPKEVPQIYEKVDGSMGTIFYYKGRWRIATKGSLNSDQARIGERMFGLYNWSNLDPELTYIVEIVYPADKKVVDYGNFWGLVYLGAINTEYGYDETEYQRVMVPWRLCESYAFSFEEAVKKLPLMDKNEEGFVVWYRDANLRLKLKAPEYLKIHKIISHLSPLAVYETMKRGKVDEKYLMEIPEEFRADAEEWARILEENYSRIEAAIAWEAHATRGLTDRELGITIKENPTAFKHPSALFAFRRKNLAGIEPYIMKLIRPTGNVL